MKKNEVGAVDEVSPPPARAAEAEEWFCWNT